MIKSPITKIYTFVRFICVAQSRKQGPEKMMKAYLKIKPCKFYAIANKRGQLIGQFKVTFKHTGAFHQTIVVNAVTPEEASLCDIEKIN